MNPSPQRADPLSAMSDPKDTLELTSDQIAVDEFIPEPVELPERDSGAGGRQVLAWTLTLLTNLPL